MPSFSYKIHLDIPRWVIVAFVCTIILIDIILADEISLVKLGMWGAYLMLVVILSATIITPTHLYSLLPLRRMKIAEAEATRYKACSQKKPAMGMVRLSDRGKESWINLARWPLAGRTQILSLLKNTCCIYTEVWVEESHWGQPRVNVGLMYELSCLLTWLLFFVGGKCIASYTPIPPVVQEMAQLGIIHGSDTEKYYAHEWKYANSAKRMGDDLLEAALHGAGMKKKWGKEFTDEEQLLALELAATWYLRAAEKGSASAVLMLVYLDTMGVPLHTAQQWREQAPQAFRTLAEQESHDAAELATLQLCYRFGIGTPQDEKKAAELQRAAAPTRKTD